MKKLTLLVVLLFMVLLCSCSSKSELNGRNDYNTNEESNSIQMSSKENVDNETNSKDSVQAPSDIEKGNPVVIESNNPDLWIHVKLKTIGGKVLEWDCTDITEDENNIYYCDSNGIYVIDKKEGVSRLLSKQQECYDLQLDGGYIYFLAKSGETYSLYCVDKQGKSGKVVLTAKQLQDMDISLCEFSVVNDNVYIEYQLQVYSFNMSSGELKRVVDDANKYVVSDKYIYYIDHGQRTFTIYKKNLNDMKTEKVLGNGISEPKEEFYDDFVLAGNDMYYVCRKTVGECGLYYFSGGKSTPIIDKLTAYISAIYEYKGDIYYLSQTDDFKEKLMKYDIKNKSISQIAELRNQEVSSFGIKFVNGYAYYLTKENKVLGISLETK